MTFKDSLGTEVVEGDEILTGYGNGLAEGRIVKLSSGLDPTNPNPIAMVGIIITKMVLANGQLLDVISKKSLAGPAPTVTI